MPRIPTSRKGWRNKADKLWSIYIRQRDKKCQWCKIKPAVDPHHIFTRSISVLRHDPCNGIGLCKGCHMQAHQHSIKFTEFVRLHLGQMYDILYRKAYQSTGSKAAYQEACMVLEGLIND